jgi:predicted small lipoprotein YifL
MKLARLFLAALTVSALAACGDTVTGPQANPSLKPSTEESCTLERQADGSTVCRTGQGGSGG